MDVPKKYLELIDRKVRGVVNGFVKGQSLQKSFLYANFKNGGLGLPSMLDEYAAYKIHHVASLMSTGERKMILSGSLNFNKKLVVNQDLIGNVEKALDQLKIN
jgi:hypothetical protein